MNWTEDDCFTLSCWEHFRCIADKCRHSCCMGWEIDIDEDTLRAYGKVRGSFGERLRRSIVVGDEGASFVLRGRDERCPFLNEKGLCDIILTLGEDALCQICADHPRFRNEYDSCTELGFGLCCEEAARLLLWDEAPLSVVRRKEGAKHAGERAPLSSDKENETVWDAGFEGDCPADRAEEEMHGSFPEESCHHEESEDGVREEETRFFALRDRLFALALSELPHGEKEEWILRLCGGSVSEKTPAEWAETLSALERLDSAWDEQLARLPGALPRPMPERPLSRLLVYFLFRHLVPDGSGAETAAAAAFAVFSVRLIALLWGETDGSEDALTELCRLYSSEIEYSDENLPALLALCGEAE